MKHTDEVELWGHLLGPHAAFDFCALCPGKTSVDELDAWRRWANKNLLDWDAAR